MSGASALAAAKRRRSQPAAPVVKKPVARNNYRTKVVQKQSPVEKKESQTYTNDPEHHAKESPMQLLLRHDSAIAELHKNQEILNDNILELHKALENAMDIRNIMSDIIFKTDYIDDLKTRITKLEEVEKTFAKQTIMSAFKQTALTPNTNDMLGSHEIANNDMSTEKRYSAVVSSDGNDIPVVPLDGETIVTTNENASEQNASEANASEVSEANASEVSASEVSEQNVSEASEANASEVSEQNVSEANAGEM